MSNVAAEITALLYQAAASPVGIVVTVTNCGLFQARAGQVKSKLADPALSGLVFRRSPVESEFNDKIWIVKSGVDPSEAFKNQADLDRLIEEVTADVTGTK